MCFLFYSIVFYPLPNVRKTFFGIVRAFTIPRVVHMWSHPLYLYNIVNLGHTAHITSKIPNSIFPIPCVHVHNEQKQKPIYFYHIQLFVIIIDKR